MVRENGGEVALSRDGRWMATQRRDSVSGRIVMSMVDRATDQIVWTYSTADIAGDPDFSADSRYVAFNRGTRPATELVVVHVSGSPSFVIPNTPGGSSRWSDDGRFLYYDTPAGIERIPIRTEPVFNVLGEPEVVLPISIQRGWDISPDQKTAIVSAPETGFSQTEQETLLVQWYQNWSDHLKKVFER